MPELPEVETIRRGLTKTIVGKKIVKFESRDLKVVQFETKDIEGMTVVSIERRAKILVFRLTRDVISTPQELRAEKSIEERSLGYAREDTTHKLLLCHLKMTGQLIWETCPGENEFCLKKSRVAGGHPSPDWVAKLPNVYTRAIFHFDDGSVLFFNDLRRFGYLKLYDLKQFVIPAKAGILEDKKIPGQARDDILNNIPELSKLGPEPFSDQFTIEYMMRRAAKIPNRKIKQFITDQEIISGVGNIYVDEALFYAGIMPTRAVKDIKLSEWKKIKESVIKALELGIRYGGSSEDTYVDAFGNQGTMGDHTKVYRRTGNPCPNGCGGVVKRITLGGRGTHFCPSCQE